MAYKYERIVWGIRGCDDEGREYLETRWRKKDAMELAREWERPPLNFDMGSTSSSTGFDSGLGLGLAKVEVFKCKLSELK